MPIPVSQCISKHHLCLHMFAQLLSCVKLFVPLWIVSHQTPLSRGFSRQEYFSGLPFPSPGYFPDPGNEEESPVSPASPSWESRFFTTKPFEKPIPPLNPSVHNHKSIFYICDSLFVLYKFICTNFIDSTYKQFHMVFVFLYDLLHSV